MLNLVTTSELMTIGAFAQATGLTPGALRFYADSTLLAPARIDEASGYRYYGHDQIEPATTIRRLRDIDMPLDTIALVLAGDPTQIDRHVTALLEKAQRARRAAAEVRATTRFGNDKDRKCIMIAVSGPVLAGAVDQILTATAHHPDHPVLSGVYVEAQGGSLTLTATDRYRLSTRTVFVAQSDSESWTALVDGDDLRDVMPDVRRHHLVDLSADDSGVVFRPVNRHCRRSNEEFPDYRSMLNSLPEIVTRVIVSKSALQRAMEDRQHEYLSIATGSGSIRVSQPTPADISEIEAVVTGPDIQLAFAMTTLYPAIASAVGSDVMIDISGPATPVVIRSADDGDLTTVAMPVDPSAVV